MPKPKKEEEVLPDDSFIRLSTVLKWIPVSSTTWDRWVKAKKAPQPVHLAPRTVAYNVGEIRAFMAKMRNGNADQMGAS